MPLMVDGRAGILRCLWPLYPGLRFTQSLLPEIISVDLSFLDSVYDCTRDWDRGNVHMRVVEGSKDLFAELGGEPVVKMEHGLPKIYFRMWSGVEVDLGRAPSGLREVFPLVAALASKRADMVFVEEPESHLHPRAIRLLTRLIVNTVRGCGKMVVMTTHSDVVVSQVNNLIIGGVLPPESVSAYLLRRVDGRVDAEELEVDGEGFDESMFETVAAELLEERSSYYARRGV